MADCRRTVAHRRWVAGAKLDKKQALRFGRDIAHRRQALNLTQEQLSALSGVTRNQIQNIEQGLSDRSKQTVSNPRSETLVELSRALGGSMRIDAAHPSGLVIEFIPDAS